MTQIHPMLLGVITLVSAFASSQRTHSQQPSPMLANQKTNQKQREKTGFTPAQDKHQNWNLSAPTFGGKQFWTDQFVYRNWRIQQNVYTKHCRLLDPSNFRRAWGSFNACRRQYFRKIHHFHRGQFGTNDRWFTQAIRRHLKVH